MDSATLAAAEASATRAKTLARRKAFDRMITARQRYLDSPAGDMEAFTETYEDWADATREWLAVDGFEKAHPSRDDAHPSYR